jgi:hypothetical protein
MEKKQQPAGKPKDMPKVPKRNPNTDENYGRMYEENKKEIPDTEKQYAPNDAAHDKLENESLKDGTDL